MFSTDGTANLLSIQQSIDLAEQQYHIESGDHLKVEVFTNDGERIIDPDFELIPEGAQNLSANRPQLEYTVSPTGFIKLPILGNVPVQGLTLLESEELLSEEFSKSYRNPFVKMTYSNKRVVILGAPGGQVIPLENENTSLLEILALAGGIDEDARANNLRLIRGNLNNPEVFIIDLSTIEGMRASNMAIRPGDILYIEPMKRVLPATFKDYAPVLSAITSVLTLIVVIQNLKL